MKLKTMNHHTFEIIQLGHPHLRQQSVAIDNIAEPKIQILLDELLSFVIKNDGVGIAAPQVDIGKRIFIMCSRPNARYPYAPEMPATFVINPEIIWQSPEMNKDWEGCLSLPGIRALVPRHNDIKVRYISRTGNIIEANFSGFLARVFQHEYDHLDGIVFIDRIENTQDMMMEKEWLKLIASRPPLI